MFNLAMVNCEKQADDAGRVSLECKVTQASVYAHPEKPNSDNPNCALDLTSSTFSMKELQKGVLTGFENSSSFCYNTILTIDRNTKRIYMSPTKPKGADNYDKTQPGTRVTVISVALATSRNCFAASIQSGAPGIEIFAITGSEDTRTEATSGMVTLPQTSAVGRVSPQPKKT
jgi:hypothetical protein